MTTEGIFYFKHLLIKHGNLQAEDFILSSTWVEYYNPKELVKIEKYGISKKDQKKLFFDYIDHKELHPYYTIIGVNSYKHCEFIYRKCIVVINDKVFPAYEALVKGKGKSVSVFFRNKVIDFYYNNLFDKENKRNIKKIIKDSSNSIQIKILSEVNHYVIEKELII